MRSSSVIRIALSGLVAATALASVQSASAAEPEKKKEAATTSTSAARIEDGTEANAAKPQPDKVEGEDKPSEHKRWSIELNPLALTIGRYSVQGEFMPAVHHAITLNPFYTHAPVTMTANGKEVDLGSLNGFGGELGYRFYTGTKGPNGFFIGPSLIFASYSQSMSQQVTTAPGVTATAKGSDSFTSYGAALDLGGQAVIGPGVVVGGGFGLQYTKTSKDINTDNLNLASAIIAGGGVRPRFMASVGYAF